jgi:xanthine dehydrogenase molybdenum-binding subunit
MDFTLNGRAMQLDVDPDASLLDVLRDRCGLRSLKDGCAPEGSCGACTVIVDGHAVVSCARTVRRAEGRVIETLEGLPPGSRSLWADAFVATGASQCGYCSPGIVMKAEALLRREPAPDRAAIARALAGNLCRCTGYAPIIDAIALAAAVRRGEAEGVTPVPGPRYEGRELALGEKPFVGDLVAPGMLHGALRFAGVPRALVRSIDTTAARAVPGVVAVLTAADVPGRREQGLIRPDWPLLVAEGETVRYVGDVLAAVAAETREIAAAAAALVAVDLEQLPAVTDPFAALAPDAPRIHEGGNIVARSVVRRGDVDAALASAAHVASASFRTAAIEHAFLEPEAALAVPRGATGPDGAQVTDHAIHLYSPGQGAWEDRRQVASFLGLPATDVLVTQVSTGGAFGGKEDLSVQGQAALLARATGRPVLLRLTRRESLRFHVKRHPMWLDYTAACDAEGNLTAVRARITGDNGAYASVGGKVLERAAGHACGPFRVPSVDIEATAVSTNNPPSGAMRGFGANQADFAMEGVLDMLAESVGIDGWDIRWRNALDVGDRTTTGQKLGPGVGVKATLLAVKDAYKRARYAGIACAIKNVGVGNGLRERGCAVLVPAADGTLDLYHSWTEMGQGAHTVFRDLAAAELGIDPARIRVSVDTHRELDTGETTSSRATMLGGQAVLRACEALLEVLPGLGPDGRLSDLAGQEFAGEMIVDWTTKLEADVAEPVTHFAYGWATQVVILDDEGRVERVVAAHDVGKALNPVLLRGQVEGGVHMGLGMALTEAFETADGIPVNETLKSLGIIPAAAMPPVETILVEVPQPEGPHGAKGMGEAVLVPTAAAVAGALYAFDGVRRTATPMRESPAARALVPRLAREASKAPGPVAATTAGGSD